jgi:hypothetical protein
MAARGNDIVGVGIKQILLGVERAKEDGVDMPDKLADIISGQIAANSVGKKDNEKTRTSEQLQLEGVDRPQHQDMDRPWIKEGEEEYSDVQDEYE